MRLFFTNDKIPITKVPIRSEKPQQLFLTLRYIFILDEKKKKLITFYNQTTIWWLKNTLGLWHQIKQTKRNDQFARRPRKYRLVQLCNFKVQCEWHFPAQSYLIWQPLEMVPKGSRLPNKDKFQMTFAFELFLEVYAFITWEFR